MSLGFGFLFLGMVLLFDSVLLTIGNLCLLVGFPFLMGLQRTLLFFNPVKRRDRALGILCFLFGILLVFLWRWTVVGMAIEVFGLLDMFGTFLPNVVATLRYLPVVGPIVSHPIVTSIVDRLSSKQQRRSGV